jgi:hypothetical protein
MTLSLKTIQRLLSLFFVFLIYLTGTQSVNAADLLKNLQPELSNKKLIKEELMRNRPSTRSCQPCFGPQGPTGCPGPRGPAGVAGLLNIAAYENYSTGDAVTFTAGSPISFGEQTVLLVSGSAIPAIQSAAPFNYFTLAQGDYQIDVGVSNSFPTPDPDLQLLVNLNGLTLFSWPASPTIPPTDAPAYVSFSTIINVAGSSGTLAIVPSATVTLSGGTVGSTIAYINIIQLNPPPITTECCVQQ